MKIIVLGAYGYTGRLVCAELVSKDKPFAIAGRKPTSLEVLKEELGGDIEIELVEMTEESSIDRLVSLYDVFINCAGPYTEMAPLLVSKIALTNKFYCDLTGELAFVQESRDNFHKVALNNKATIIHSCAFESVLTSLLIPTLLPNSLCANSIKVYYDTGHSKPSPGTKLTMKLSRFRKTYLIENGLRVDNTKIAPFNLDIYGNGVEFAAVAYPLPDVCFFDWDTGLENIGVYVLLDPFDARYIFNKKVEDVDEGSKQLIFDKYHKRRAKGPKVESRKKQEFVITVDVEDLTGNTKRLRMKGQDMYQLTAVIAVYFSMLYLNGKGQQYGVITPNAFIGKEHTFFEDIGLEWKHIG